jgi:cytoskeletal protein CcmA (bactofilin family)
MAEIHARKVDEKKIDTVLEEDVSFEGEVLFNKDLMIKGKFQGKIKSRGAVYIGDNADVRAEINADSVVVRGTLVGNVVAGSRIELLETAKVKGDITAPKIVIDPGCQFDGNSRMTAQEASS